MDITEIETMTIDDRFKGIPGGTPPFALGEIGDKGWNVLREDLPLPLAVLKRSELDNNRIWMTEFLRRAGAAFCPHGKAVMAPQLVKEMLDDGAWGITVANVAQLQVYRRFGVNRVIFANQIVGRQSLRFILDELARDPGFEFYGLIDSLEGIAALTEAAKQHDIGRPVRVLIEGGYPGARNGCRTLEEALQLARGVKRSEPYVELHGVKGYEGILPGRDHAETANHISSLLGLLIEIAAACIEEELLAPGPVILSAGGSQYPDMVVDRFAEIEIGREILPLVRAGSFLTHDSGFYMEAFDRLLQRSARARELGGGLKPAVEIWAYVQSRPDADRIILTMGKRDCSYDLGLPIPLRWFRPNQHDGPHVLDSGHEVTRLDDQHAYMTVPPGSELRVGDMVCCGISHPTTFVNKWRLLYVVNDGYDVVSGIVTFF